MIIFAIKRKMFIARVIKPVSLELNSQWRRWLSTSYPLRNQKSNVTECKKAGPETHCIFDMCAIRPGTPQPCVVIIGGGLAGLSAAARLTQCGITNLRILEAMDNPGGRVRTCWLGDSVVEAGWPQIDGACLANPLFTLAAQERLLPVPIQRLEEAPMILTSEGRAVDDRLTAKARELFQDVENSATEPLPAFPKHSSLEGRIKAGLEERLKDVPKHDRWDISRALNGYISALKTRLGQSLNELCPEILSDLTPLPGGSVAVKGGMSSLLAPLVRNLPAGALVTCKPVNMVLWGTAGPGAPRAVVKACDGENYPADYVIVTVPLGVLKASGEKMFCPQLPAFKMEAVRGLGFGFVNKIFLKFETPFWVEDSGEFIFSWSPEELSDEETWIKGITGMDIVRGSKKVVSLTVSGREAIEMESLSDTDVAEGVSRLLRRYLGNKALPRPTEILRSSWSGSPYFGGYKTYLGRGSGRGMVNSLAIPLPSDCDDVPPIILFAGEHTHPEYFGTPHGSRLSGIREADRIVKLTKRFNGPPYKGPICIPCT